MEIFSLVAKSNEVRLGLDLLMRKQKDAGNLGQSRGHSCNLPFSSIDLNSHNTETLCIT